MKTHLVLLDNRYEFDREVNDRLGAQQWDWLDKSLATHKDADLTLILAGVQMIRDNSVIDEGFDWENKIKLFETIARNEVSNVVLLSGDVHFANAYQSACKALTGYGLYEITSSGMSHTIDSFNTALVREFIEVWQAPIYTTNRIVTKYNYGDVIIDTVNKKVKMAVRDLDGGSHYLHDLDLLKDLNFDAANLKKNPELCRNVQRD